MRFLIKPFKSLLFTMMFISLASIIALVTFVSFIYVSSLEKVEGTLVENKLIETQSFAKLFERDIEKIHEEMYDLLSNNLVTTLPIKFQTQLPTTRFAYEINLLQSSMKSKQNSHNFLDSFTISFPKIKRQLTVNSVRNYTVTEELELKNMINRFPERVALTDTSLLFWMSYPYQYKVDYDQPSVILTSIISKDNINKYLKTYYNSESSSQFAVYIDIQGTNHFLAGTSSVFRNLGLFEQHKVKDNGLFYETISHNDDSYLLTGYSSSLHGMTFYQLTPDNSIMTPLESYKKSMVVFLVIIISLTLGTTLIVYLMVYRPIAHAQKNFSLMESGDLSARMGSAWHDEFQDMYRQFDSMSDHIQDLIELEYELKILGTKAELKQLQYQINPHFLYNTYFILCGLLQEEENEQAIILSETIGRFLRYITNSHNEHASLREEIEHARAYTQIQQMRYSNRVQIEFGCCPEEFSSFEVPRLIIQPLIENAFEHGVKHVIHNALIKISFIAEGNRLAIVVEDNGEGLTQDKPLELQAILSGEQHTLNEGIALYNIHNRLRMTYGDQSGLDISISELGGFCCIIHLNK